jgi:G protein beta subunit-like protein
MMSLLASASYDHTIKFWNAATGVCVQTVQHKESQVSSLIMITTNLNIQVNALEITPDGCQLAAAGYGHIRMYDLQSPTPTAVINFEGVSKNITAVGFQADGRFMFTGGEDCTAKLWDMRVRQLQCQRIFQVPIHGEQN